MSNSFDFEQISIYSNKIANKLKKVGHATTIHEMLATSRSSNYYLFINHVNRLCLNARMEAPSFLLALLDPSVEDADKEIMTRFFIIGFMQDPLSRSYNIDESY